MLVQPPAVAERVQQPAQRVDSGVRRSSSDGGKHSTGRAYLRKCGRAKRACKTQFWKQSLFGFTRPRVTSGLATGDPNVLAS